LGSKAAVLDESDRLDSGVHAVPANLGTVENRARLSLECYRYTRDDYWLECASADCKKGGLDWESLCERELGSALPRPKCAAERGG
jgi:hypothetical protein